MDWHVKPLSRQCGVTGEAFEPGERVVCFVFKDENGELQRIDVKEQQVGHFEVPPSLMGRWIRIIPEKEEDPESETKKQSIKSAEEFFLALFEDNDATTDNDIDILKQILALMLERKRILRRQENLVDMIQDYLHVPSKAIYKVPMKDFDIGDIARIQEQLKHIII